MAAQLALLEPASQVTPSIEAKFEEFWSIYPKRAPYPNPRLPAQQKFARLIRRANINPDLIIAGARAYAFTRVGEDPKFTTMAVTFLNQHRWTCDYSAGTGLGPTTCGSSYADLARKLAGNGKRPDRGRV
jgi:hypothetical protein